MVTHEHDALLTVDELQAGYGRTGEPWGSTTTVSSPTPSPRQTGPPTDCHSARSPPARRSPTPRGRRPPVDIRGEPGCLCRGRGDGRGPQERYHRQRSRGEWLASALDDLQAAVNGFRERLDAVTWSRDLVKRGEFDTVSVGRGRPGLRADIAKQHCRLGQPGEFRLTDTCGDQVLIHCPRQSRYEYRQSRRDIGAQ